MNFNRQKQECWPVTYIYILEILPTLIFGKDRMLLRTINNISNNFSTTPSVPMPTSFKLKLKLKFRPQRMPCPSLTQVEVEDGVEVAPSAYALPITNFKLKLRPRCLYR